MSSIRNLIHRRRALDFYGEAPDGRIVLECAFDEYEEAFSDGSAGMEEVRFAAVLSLTMMLFSKALFLHFGNRTQAETLDLARIYSVSQSAAASVHRMLVRGLPLRPVEQTNGEMLIDTAVVLDFLRTLKRWTVAYGYEPEVQKRISEVIPYAIAQYVLWYGARKN